MGLQFYLFLSAYDRTKLGRWKRREKVAKISQFIGQEYQFVRHFSGIMCVCVVYNAYIRLSQEFAYIPIKLFLYNQLVV